MKRTYIFLISSAILLVLLTSFLFIKKNKPSFMTGKEVVYLNDSSFTTVNITIGKYMSYDEYLIAKKPPTTVEKIENKVIGGKNVEVIYLGNIGVLGEKLDIRYIDSETHLDEDAYMEYMAELEDPANNPGVEEPNASLAPSESPEPAESPSASETPEESESPEPSNLESASPEPSNLESASPSESPSESPAATPSESPLETPIESPMETPAETPIETPANADNTIIRAEAVREYVSPANSVQRMGYIIYAPANATANTPIFLFLHGIGQNGNSYNTFIGSISFLKYLVNGNWTPDCILVAPICPGGSKWINETANIDAMLNEVIANFGGNRSNMYIGGFSAGCDSMTPIAKQIPFRGAIYMAGYLGAVGNTTPVDEFLRLWSGKDVYYFRDSLYGAGGYGYKPDYVSACENNAAAYGVNFKHIDMHWAHRSTMIDAVLMPSYFTDAKGNPCLDMLNKIIK